MTIIIIIKLLIIIAIVIILIIIIIKKLLFKFNKCNSKKFIINIVNLKKHVKNHIKKIMYYVVILQKMRIIFMQFSIVKINVKNLNHDTPKKLTNVIISQSNITGYYDKKDLEDIVCIENHCIKKQTMEKCCTTYNIHIF